MNITDKINFRQPKYVLPAIVYLPLLFTGYFVCDFFNLKPVETSKMETTNYYNDKLPSANIKGDGIGQKYQNMVENFGKIKDGSAVENIEGRTEKEKEKYESQYSDAELAAMDSTSESSKNTTEQIEEIKNRIHNQQKKDESLSSSDLSEDERKLLELRKALEKQNKHKKTLPKQIHKLYEGKNHHLNIQNLLQVMTEVGLSNKLFVMAQAVLETGNFKSRVCREYNNLFGLYDSRHKDYFRFEKWEDSVVGYQKMIQRRYKGGNYLRFLKQIRYAEDPKYIPKIAKTAKWLYEENEHLFQTKSSVSS